MTTESVDPNSPILPAHLKAMLELTRQAEASSRWRLRDYLRTAFLCILLTVMVSIQTPSGNAMPTLILGIFLIMFSLHEVSESRARERMRLILEVLRYQTSRDTTASKAA